jgi:hypothetical protein
MESDKLTRHHRLPKSRNGANDPPNVVKVPQSKHEAWHILFSNMTAQEVLEQMNDWWIDPRYKLCLVPTKQPIDPEY